MAKEKYRVYSTREFEKILRKNGYSILRHRGDHTIWAKAEGHVPNITIAKTVNPMIARRLIKENNLIVD